MLETAIRAKPVLSIQRENGFFTFDEQECAEAGKSLHAQYVGNQPFPHIVIDNFLDTEILRRVVDEFPPRERGKFSDDYSRLKTGYTHAQIKSAHINDLLNALNTAAFLGFLEEMTGIDGLISDAHYTGGGLHETARGGHLSIHADFNLHPKTNILRRLNLILFLNEDWKDEYGGHLELWDRQMKGCQKAVAPVLGRAVVFNTDTTSYHGHPEPLSCPDGIYRRSLALYYYTAPPSGRMVKHTTLFQPRAGTADAPLPFSEKLMQKVRRMINQR